MDRLVVLCFVYCSFANAYSMVASAGAHVCGSEGFLLVTRYHLPLIYSLRQ
jgi:hypothetical protein